MDRIINVKVGGYHLTKDKKIAGVRGEGNVAHLRITFDESWDKLAKTVTFFDAEGNNPVKRIQGIDLIEDIINDKRTYLTPIPAEPMAIAGKLSFVIDGYFDGKRQRSLSDELIVEDAPIIDDAAEPTDPTPTQAEQLQSEIDYIKGNIQEAITAKDGAEKARDEAEQSEKIALRYAEESAADADEAGAQANNAKVYSENAEEYANKAEEAISHNPIIVDGYWHIWSAPLEEYINTGIKAQAGSEVYMGDNPPDSADVWIDPNGQGDDLEKMKADIEAHTSNTDNPHSVTKSQIGLGNADNTSDMDKPISRAMQEAFDSINEAIEQISGIVADKSDKADKLSGYGITDAYTKDEVITLINNAIGEALEADY